MKLTKTLIEKAEPREKKYRLNDSIVPGLVLLVLPSGVKTFYVRYRNADGEFREMKLGTPLELTPDDARRMARDVWAAVRAGGDPSAERKTRKEAPTLEDLAERYMKDHGSRKRSGFNDEALWRLHILPKLGRTRVAQLTREQVRRFHAEHPRPVTANRALEVLGKAMDLAIEYGWREAASNPCRGVKANPESKRERYLQPDELKRLKTALQEWEWGGPSSLRWRFAQLVRLLLLTGARLRNVMEARWEWVDWDRGCLVVPPSDHKTGHATGSHLRIHLSDRALEVLLKLKDHSGGSPWVIHGAKKERPLNGYRKFWLSLLNEAQIQDLRVHDLRHTFASYTLSTGHSLGVVGQLLGHQSTQTTSRYAHLVDGAAREAVRSISASLDV